MQVVLAVFPGKGITLNEFSSFCFQNIPSNNFYIKRCLYLVVLRKILQRYNRKKSSNRSVGLNSFNQVLIEDLLQVQPKLQLPDFLQCCSRDFF